jgi:hypothetical protein
LEWLAGPLLIAGFVLMFAGFWFHVQAKGYNPVWTLLIFLLGPLAFLVLFILPDRERQSAQGT